jgi:hypothetical protein
MGQSSRRLLDYSSLAVDVHGATGSTGWIDFPRRGFAIFMAELLTLVGGSTPGVTFAFEESNDQINATVLETMAALSAAGIVAHRIEGTGKRYLRISWATTGTPSSATANLFITGR